MRAAVGESIFSSFLKQVSADRYLRQRCFYIDFLFKRVAKEGGGRHGKMQNSRLYETFLSLDFLCYCDPASFRAPSLRSIFILL